MTATERMQRELDIFFQGYWEGVRQMKEQSKRKDNVKIEDCKTLPEFFGVEHGGQVWIEGISFRIFFTSISGEMTTAGQDSQALVGCLTGQLKWSTEDCE